SDHNARSLRCRLLGDLQANSRRTAEHNHPLILQTVSLHLNSPCAFFLCILVAYTVKDDSPTPCGSCIIVISVMRLEKLRQVDLNLLITFAAIAEEKSITAAASRLLLSQPAVSRALQRARMMFQDDLLVRSPQGFELTLRGRKVLQELEGLLPRMENLVTPSLFY